MRRYHELKLKQIVRDINRDVPAFRSYGSTKPYRPRTEKMVKWLLRIVFVLLALVYTFGFFVGMIAVIRYLPGVLVGFVFCVLLTVLVIFCVTRTLRKRLKFKRNLKKLCKKYGFSLQHKRNFFQSFAWSPEQYDFTVQTKQKRYYVHFLTLQKYRATLFLESENQMRLVKYPLPNIVTFLFEIKPKIREYRMNFQESTEGVKLPIMKVLLVNPVCEEIKYRQENRGYEHTGSGGEHFGFTVFTGTGFLNALAREE